MNELFILRDSVTNIYGFINNPIPKKAAKTYDKLENLIKHMKKGGKAKYVVIYKLFDLDSKKMCVNEVVLVKKALLDNNNDIKQSINNYGVSIWKRDKGFIFDISMIYRDVQHIYKDIFELFDKNMNADGYIVAEKKDLGDEQALRKARKIYTLDTAFEQCLHNDIICSFNTDSDKKISIVNVYEKHYFKYNPGFKMVYVDSVNNNSIPC